jgi:alpha-1,2-mannosyltransferase
MAATADNVRDDSSGHVTRRFGGGRLVAGGLTVLALAVIWYLGVTRTSAFEHPTDLTVYRDAGLLVRHVSPFYDPHQASPLYDWPGPRGLGLRFAYPPFAALLFALLSYLSLHSLAWLFALADVLAIPAAIWMTLGALGVPRGRRRAGLTLLATAAALMTEPVLRAIALGQVEIVLLLLIIWDMSQPDRRWWKGAGIGLAAGIKLVPLIFIPYLLLTRRFKQAAVAAGAFGATIVIGFIALPRDSALWWLHGRFIHESYQRNIQYAGNQSLLAVIFRTGSPDWHTQWLTAAVITGVLGLAVAAALSRAGHHMIGLATCALTGLLVSPISWDHHWVWIVLAAPLLAHQALHERGLARWIWSGLAVLVVALFAAWPTSLWGGQYGWNLGLIWAPPDGDNRETGWHGFQLIVGNAYVLTGLAIFFLLAAVAYYSRRRRPMQAELPDNVVEALHGV